PTSPSRRRLRATRGHDPVSNRGRQDVQSTLSSLVERGWAGGRSARLKLLHRSNLAFGTAQSVAKAWVAVSALRRARLVACMASWAAPEWNWEKVTRCASWVAMVTPRQLGRTERTSDQAILVSRPRALRCSSTEWFQRTLVKRPPRPMPRAQDASSSEARKVATNWVGSTCLVPPMKITADISTTERADAP